MGFGFLGPSIPADTIAPTGTINPTIKNKAITFHGFIYSPSKYLIQAHKIGQAAKLYHKVQSLPY
jgi:hypothetical protein